MKVSELKEKLKDFGYSNDELEKNNKKELEQILNHCESTRISLNYSSLVSINTDDEIIQESTEKITAEKKPTDQDWTEYVLSLMDPKREMDNGNPKTDGLRRVTELLLGEFNERTNIVGCPNIDNAGRATVVVTIEFVNGRYFEGAADVYSGNTARDFAKHAVATAETRAEGRALKKALRLTKVWSAEELMQAESEESSGVGGDGTPKSMIDQVKIISGMKGFDLLKVAQKNGININAIEELTEANCIQIAKIIGDYSRGTLQVTDDIKA